MKTLLKLLIFLAIIPAYGSEVNYKLGKMFADREPAKAVYYLKKSFEHTKNLKLIVAVQQELNNIYINHPEVIKDKEDIEICKNLLLSLKAKNCWSRYAKLCCNLGEIYQQVNLNLAVKYYQDVIQSKLGFLYPVAHYNLAMIYQDGDVVTRDLQKASDLYNQVIDASQASYDLKIQARSQLIAMAPELKKMQ